MNDNSIIHATFIKDIFLSFTIKEVAITQSIIIKIWQNLASGVGERPEIITIEYTKCFIIIKILFKTEELHDIDSLA